MPNYIQYLPTILFYVVLVLWLINVPAILHYAIKDSKQRKKRFFTKTNVLLDNIDNILVNPNVQNRNKINLLIDSFKYSPYMKKKVFRDNIGGVFSRCYFILGKITR